MKEKRKETDPIERRQKWLQDRLKKHNLKLVSENRFFYSDKVGWVTEIKTTASGCAPPPIIGPTAFYALETLDRTNLSVQRINHLTTTFRDEWAMLYGYAIDKLKNDNWIPDTLGADEEGNYQGVDHPKTTKWNIGGAIFHEYHRINKLLIDKRFELNPHSVFDLIAIIIRFLGQEKEVKYETLGEWEKDKSRKLSDVIDLLWKVKHYAELNIIDRGTAIAY